jgi:hypothetical protein
MTFRQFSLESHLSQCPDEFNPEKGPAVPSSSHVHRSQCHNAMQTIDVNRAFVYSVVGNWNSRNAAIVAACEHFTYLVFYSLKNLSHCKYLLMPLHVCTQEGYLRTRVKEL